MNTNSAGLLSFVRLVSCCLLLALLSGCGGASIDSGSSSVAGPLAISTVSPKNVPVGSPAVTIVVTGTGFTPTTVIQLAGVPLQTTYISSTQIQATIPASQLQTGKLLKLAVANGANVVAADAGDDVQVDNPEPTVSALAPSSVLVDSPSETITVTGTNFVSGITLTVNGSPRSTTYVSATQLTASLTSDDFLSAAPRLLNAVNPQPGGGASGTIALVVTNPVPTVTSLSPNALNAGSAATVVNIVGTGFVAGTGVLVNGASRPATLVSATAMTVALTFADLSTAGSLGITAVNPAPGGGVSSSSSIAINNPVPGAITLTPASATAGTGTAQISVTGSGFVPATVVFVNGQPRTTTYVNAKQLVASLTSTDLATAGSLSIIATNPSPGGGSTAAASLSVNNPAPGSILVTPNLVTTGTASETPITVIGANFVPSTVVQINGSSRATTFISSTQLLSSLTVADQATAGSLSVNVFTPTPGGGTSSAASIAINNSALGAISLSPSTVPVGKTTSTIITVTGSGVVPGTGIQVNGSARATTYVSANQVSFVLPVSDVSAAGVLNVTAVNPAPNYSVSIAATLTVVAPNATPVIASLSPTSAIEGSPELTLSAMGTGFTSNCTLQWNATALTTNYSYNTIYDPSTGTYTAGYGLFATIPASLLTTVGSANITANCPAAISPTSNAITFNVTTPPVPTLTSIYPNAGQINSAADVTLNGTGFTGNTTVALNGVTIPSTYVSPTQITATFPASSVAIPGNISVTATTPAPGGGTSSSQVYTAYISIPNNDIAYNPADGLLYASVPSEAIGALGNCVVGVDPLTGAVTRQIFVGTNPNKLAISTDGTQLFVGLDGAAAVAQVDLTQGKVVNQFSLGGGPGVYNPPYTAQYLAAVPGSPNSVAVAIQGGFPSGPGVTIFDSGVARTASYSSVGEGPLSFGSSASNLYIAGSSVADLTVGSTGITGATTLSIPPGNASSLQYDNGRLYLSTGTVANASTGGLLGTFFSTASTPASGPIVSDSTLGSAFIGVSSFSTSGQVLAFDESSFNLTGSIPVNGVGTQGYPTSFRKIVRWGQNGIALSTIPSAFSSTNQIYIFQSPLVKDLSSSPADLSVSLIAPATTTTGTAITWAATVSNSGPNSAAGATLAMDLDPSLIIGSIIASQGSCGTGVAFTCDLGSLANGASATVTVSATPTNSGTLAGTANASSSSYDPNFTNNQSTSSTTVTGGLYGAVPAISAITPNLVQAGSSDFTFTVTGTGFNTASTVNLGTAALATTYVSAMQLTATVTTSEIANYGWAPVTVSNPTPGGGASPIVPLTIYDVVNVPANAILFDPYSQLLYASIPGTAPNLTGNSVVTVNPVTGAVGTPVAVGSQPTVMTETADGKYLYIGLSGSNSLAQFNLLTGNVAATIPLTYTSQSTPALSLAAMPGTDTTLAIGISNGWDNFGIFDVSGNTGSFRPNVSGIYEGVSPVFASPTELYAYDSQTSGAEFYRYSINTNGLTLIDGTTLDGMGGFSGGVQLANGLVYGGGGGIANPSTTPPSQIASLPLIDFYGSGISGYGAGNVPDPSLQKEFLMEENTAGTWAYGLVRYDLTTYQPEALLTMPTAASGVESNWTMLRWGQDGLALLSYDNVGVSPPTVVMMLLRGPFVAPQELGTNSAASLTSSSATTITHGSGNTMLTLTGSNFLPGVAVMWNGSYRTTTIVDTTHLRVAIPASDLATAGTASLTASNPGATTSSALTITIQ
jgi:trimeric autotransporter adhesin